MKNAFVLRGMLTLSMSSSLLSGCSGAGDAGVGQQLAGDAPDVFLQACRQCHRPPSPKVHSRYEWPPVIERMQMHMMQQGRRPMTANDRQSILDYLVSHAGR